MRRKNELAPKDLKDICNPNLFKFETTRELVDTTDLVYGQERGIKALEFGTDINIKGLPWSSVTPLIVIGFVSLIAIISETFLQGINFLYLSNST